MCGGRGNVTRKIWMTSSVRGDKNQQQETSSILLSVRMDQNFTTQDLNVIRRFLGMSLQQIDAKKVPGTI